MADQETATAVYEKGRLYTLPIGNIQPDPNRSRKYFDEEGLAELTQSIQDKGVIQPLLVRLNEHGNIVLVAGARRLRAAQAAGLTEVPALFIDDKSEEISLIENSLRRNLTAAEEAEAVGRLRGYPEIELAFLFGSFAGGMVTAESDVDIAILCRQVPSFDRREEIRAALSAGMKREVDLVVLNGASPILRMQVLKKGVILIDNASVYEDFFVRTTGEYDDLKRVRKGIEESILRGGIGGANA
ncbi:MAG: type VII toxin-antitoxin system MntA family adenylyltransferase antitoxin [Syntrophales bacterium]